MSEVIKGGERRGGTRTSKKNKNKGNCVKRAGRKRKKRGQVEKSKKRGQEEKKKERGRKRSWAHRER